MGKAIPLLFGTLAAVLSANAMPTSSSPPSFDASLERRIVGSLSCKVHATGNLILYNTKTKASVPVTYANNYRLDSVPGGSSAGVGNPRVLSSYPGATSQTFEFLACTESQKPGFEDLPAVAKNGTAYGHISGKNPNYCLNLQRVYGDSIYLVAEKCNYSDDSGSPFSYFSYRPSENGQINYLGFTGKKGGEPTPPEGAYDFTPGTSKSPAISVHEGSPQFSDYVLRLT